MNFQFLLLKEERKDFNQSYTSAFLNQFSNTKKLHTHIHKFICLWKFHFTIPNAVLLWQCHILACCLFLPLIWVSLSSGRQLVRKLLQNNESSSRRHTTSVVNVVLVSMGRCASTSCWEMREMSHIFSSRSTRPFCYLSDKKLKLVIVISFIVTL